MFTVHAEINPLFEETVSQCTNGPIFVISSGARDLAFFSYMGGKISRPWLEMTIATQSAKGK
jgi:hypothetical protein